MGLGEFDLPPVHLGLGDAAELDEVGAALEVDFGHLLGGLGLTEARLRRGQPIPCVEDTGGVESGEGLSGGDTVAGLHREAQHAA